MSTPIKKDWTTESGLRAVIVMNSLGFHCGYVGVPPGHPLHGVEYSQSTPALGDSPESVFDAHGGITFAGDGKGEYPVKSDLWWFGYDCGHLWDAPCPEHIEKMQQEYPDSPFMWERAEGVFRDVDYCVAECESLARQIADAAQGQEEA